jgi:hypothetical protein
MEYKTSKYQRDRSRFQQEAVTALPCISCSKLPSQNAHIIPVLEGRKKGLPMKILNEDWNLVPLCIDCHHLFDAWLDRWAKKHTRIRYGHDMVEVVTRFRQLVNHCPGIEAYDLSSESVDNDDVFCSSSDEFELAWVSGEDGSFHTCVITKWGYFGIRGKFIDKIDSNETELQLEKVLEGSWNEAWRELKVPSSKEYRELFQLTLQEAESKRRELLVLLKDRIETATEKATSLLTRVHAVKIELGSLLNNQEVSGFDFTTARQGYITVLTWESPHLTSS